MAGKTGKGKAKHRVGATVGLINVNKMQHIYWVFEPEAWCLTLTWRLGPQAWEPSKVVVDQCRRTGVAVAFCARWDMLATFSKGVSEHKGILNLVIWQSGEVVIYVSNFILEGWVSLLTLHSEQSLPCTSSRRVVGDTVSRQTRLWRSNSLRNVPNHREKYLRLQPARWGHICISIEAIDITEAISAIIIWKLPQAQLVACET